MERKMSLAVEERSGKRVRTEESFAGPMTKRPRTLANNHHYVSIVSTANLETFIPKSVKAAEDRQLLVRVLAQLVTLNNHHRALSATMSAEHAARIDPHPKIHIRDLVNTDEDADSGSGAGAVAGDPREHYYEIHMEYPCTMVTDATQYDAIHEQAPARIPKKTIRQYTGMEIPATVHLLVNVHSLMYPPLESDLTVKHEKFKFISRVNVDSSDPAPASSVPFFSSLGSLF